MHKTLRIFGLLAALILLWWIFYPWATWRYKMTVIVETPEGLKIGSVIREINVGSEPALLGTSGGGTASVKGEAVIVDLGNRGKLFVLNNYPYSDSAMKYVFLNAFPPPKGVGAMTAAGIRHYTFLGDAKSSLSPDYNLLMITFTDLKNPKTVKLVKAIKVRSDNRPYTIDRMEEIFGKGVYIKHIIIETTDEPVTWEIEKSMPWLFTPPPYGPENPPFAIELNAKDEAGAPISFRLTQDLFSTGRK